MKDHIFDALVKMYRPRGWKLRRPKAVAVTHPGFRVAAMTDWDSRTISIVRESHGLELYRLWLHEVAHVTLKHATLVDHDDWRAEYEAERFAINELRRLGFAVPRSVVDHAKAYVASFVQHEDDVDAEARVWLYGRTKRSN